MRSQAAINLVAPGMGIDVIASDHLLFHQAGYNRMIARYLGKLALAVQVGAAIAHICYMSRAADNERCCYSCSHQALLPPIAPVQSEVRVVGSFGQKFREAALILHIIEHCWYYSIPNGFDCLAAGLLPVFVSSHTIGHHKQANWVRAGTIGACSMYSQEIILVRIFFAPDARV